MLQSFLTLKVEKSLLQWYDNACFHNHPLDDEIFLNMAQKFANNWDKEGALAKTSMSTYSEQWLQKFKSKHGIVLRGDHGFGDLPVYSRFAKQKYSVLSKFMYLSAL